MLWKSRHVLAINCHMLLLRQEELRLSLSIDDINHHPSLYNLFFSGGEEEGRFGASIFYKFYSVSFSMFDYSVRFIIVVLDIYFSA